MVKKNTIMYIIIHNALIWELIFVGDRFVDIICVDEWICECMMVCG